MHPRLLWCRWVGLRWISLVTGVRRMEPFMIAVRTLHVTPVRRDQFAANLIDRLAPRAFDLDQCDYGFFEGSGFLLTISWLSRIRFNPIIVFICRACSCICVNYRRSKIGDEFRGIVLGFPPAQAF